METTYEKVTRFARFLESQHREHDAVIDAVLDKLIERERQMLLTQISELCVEVDRFEKQYGLESPEFHGKFERGEMGDAMDFFLIGQLLGICTKMC